MGVLTSTALAIRDAHDLTSWGDRKLDNAIRRGHAAAGAHMRGYEEAATLTGLLLIERRRRLKHGEWTPWLAEHFDGHQNTALRYIRLAREWLANSPSAVSLNPPPKPPDEPLVDDDEVVDAEVVDDPPAPSRANGKRRQTDGSQLVDWLPDMLPGASPEGAFRQEVLSWCSQERSLDGMLDGTGIALVPKSDDDRAALLDALTAIHETAARLERQLGR